ncbi:hypothetical protein KD796_26985, partial [Klebsiella pneumoniae]|uniref:hypothetical protein n=1 Tax=Klebsiella pneumoniae TaxID=573 RepID=UPI003D214470
IGAIIFGSLIGKRHIATPDHGLVNIVFICRGWRYIFNLCEYPCDQTMNKSPQRHMNSFSGIPYQFRIIIIPDHSGTNLNPFTST